MGYNRDTSESALQALWDRKDRLIGIKARGGSGKFMSLDFPIPRRTSLKKCHGGRMTSIATAGVDHTSAHSFTTESKVGLMRLWIFNNLSVALTGVKVAYAASSVAGAANSAATIDPTLNGGAWLNVPFAGSTAGATIAPGGAASTVDNPDATPTDWFAGGSTVPLALDRTDGGKLTVHHVRIEVPGAANANIPVLYFGNVGVFENEGDDTTAPWGRFYRTRKQSVAGVTNKAAFTSTASDGQVIAIMIEYIPLDMVTGATAMILGNSLDEGVTANAAARRPSWAHVLQREVSTPEAPLEICNLAIHGAPASRAQYRVQTLMPKIRPEFMFLPWFNINSATAGGSAAQAAADMGGILGNFNLARANADTYEPLTFLLTSVPANYAGKAIVEVDKLRVLRDAKLMAAPESSRIKRIDMAAVTSGPLDANGQTTFPQSSDGIHDNDTAREAMGLAAAEVVKPLMVRV